MIGIIQKGAYIKGLLDYHYEKIKEGQGEILATNIYSQEYIDQLKFYLNTFSLHDNSRTKNKVFHASLSFSPEERISKEVMTEIAEEYMQRMGYKDVPYTVFGHLDTLHQHVHIVASRINYDGNIAVRSELDKKKNKEQCKILEKKYGLLVAEQSSKQERKRQLLSEINMQKYAVSNALKKRISAGEVHDLTPDVISAYSERQPTDKELRDLMGVNYVNVKRSLDEQNLVQYSKKYQLTQVLQKAYNGAGNQAAFTHYLEANGIYVRQLLKDGNPYFTYGLKGDGYYISEKHLPERFSFASTAIMGEEKLQKANELEVSKQKRYIKTHVNKLLKGNNNQAVFETGLKKFGIDFRYSYTNQGKIIQGISFRREGEWYKASEIDRNLSWNKILSSFTSPVVEINDQKMDPLQSNVEPNVLNISNKNSKLPPVKGVNSDHTSDKTAEEKEQERIRRKDRDQEM